MSVQSEIDRIITAVGNAYSKVSEKGGTVPSSQTVANLATAIGSIPTGGAKETWVLNERLSGSNATYTIDFTSNGTRYSKLTTSMFSDSRLKYGDILVCGKRPGGAQSGWIDQAYRKLTFDAPPTGSLLKWLQKNGVKQPDDTAVQDTKAVTITSNGTVSVTPDVPYDGLSSVDVTVDVVADVPLVTVTFKAIQFGDEISSPDDSAHDEMSRIVISAFVDGNISLSSMNYFSNQWGGGMFPFDVAVPQGSSVTICAGQPGMGGSTTVTNAQIARWQGTEGITVVYTIYNITDGATITIDVT